jgi:hypothetical protein
MGVKGSIPWNIGISPSAETRYKIGSANRGKKLSPEICKKMSESKKGQNTWSKGRKASEETRAKMREARKGRIFSEETRAKLREAGKKRPGIVHTAETKEKMRIAHTGKRLTPETCAKISEIHKGMKYSESTKEKLRKRWENYSPKKKAEIIKQMLKISIPNKMELSLADLLESMYPGEWKFVGDGKIIIAGKCPDFININGQKKIIELYGERWHQGHDPKDREAVFAPYGYKTLVVWGKELKYLKSLVRKIETFYRL